VPRRYLKVFFGFSFQQAIAAQVEAKRLQKQLEKEQKIREDEEAEERFKKQQETLRQRLEDEQNKEREKQVRRSCGSKVS